MSEFYTRIGDGKYEVHFITDSQYAAEQVERACREAIGHMKPNGQKTERSET